MAAITLYDLPGCPFCMRVKRTLEKLDLEYDVIEVPAAHEQRSAVREVSGQTGVPVIVDDEHGVDGMAESSDIVTYLEDTYGDG